MKKLEDLVVGDKLLICRSDGAEQEAEVHRWISNPKSLPYTAPEVVIMQVTFYDEMSQSKAFKCIAGLDFIKVLT